MIQKADLIRKIQAYSPTSDASLLAKAYDYSMRAHKSQLRQSGEPYFSHPLGVAEILVTMKMDADSIITALLHDTVEDTVVTLQEIEREFGLTIASLVDGVTKLSRIGFLSDEEKQAENFRKLVVAMSTDIRVLLIKLADRLHNMRTLKHISSEEKRKRIARETMDIYAPLADRIGMQSLKDELEDLAFSELNPEARNSIIARLAFLRHKGSSIIDTIVDELQKLFFKNNQHFSITGREKSPYSIWRKMQRKNIGFEQLSDIMAFRVVVDDLNACYQALGIVHSAYPMIPGRFKDYISTPKPNHYQSLHTTVIGPSQHRIEIQIRTHDMHEIADLGVAAHWNYKVSDNPPTGVREYRWLRSLLDILEHASGPEELLEHTKLEMFQDQVFCFTPKGDLIALPRGSTPVDFAYAVHSAVGDRCVGAKINGRMVPLRAILNNGDQVDILTAKTQTPSAAWERFVITGKARACIRRFIRSQQRSQYVTLGKSIAAKAFRQVGFELHDSVVGSLLKNFKFSTNEDLYAAVGVGQISGRDLVRTAFPDIKDDSSANYYESQSTLKSQSTRPTSSDSSVVVEGLIPGMAIHYAGCCHPLPGDRIVGIVVTGKGVTIHTNDCETLVQYHDQPERWIDLDWGAHQSKPHIGRMSIVASNAPGSLSNITNVIVKNTANIVNLKISNRTNEFCDMLIDVEVRDGYHMDSLILSLRSSPFVSSIDRAKN